MKRLNRSWICWVRILKERSESLNKGKKALVIISVIILVFALAFAAYKLFRVREVTVIGCETLSEEDVIALSGLVYDQLIIEVDTDAVLEAVDENPYIKPVSVRIVYPDGVEITIEERKKAAYIQKEDTLLIIDNECCLLEVITQTALEGYPFVLGLQTDEFTVGQRLGVSDTFVLDVLSNVLQSAQEAGIGLISIDVSLAADVVLEIAEGFTVELGDDTELSTKFALIESSLEELKEQGKTGGILDVASATRVYYCEN